MADIGTPSTAFSPRSDGLEQGPGGADQCAGRAERRRGGDLQKGSLRRPNEREPRQAESADEGTSSGAASSCDATVELSHVEVSGRDFRRLQEEVVSLNLRLDGAQTELAGAADAKTLEVKDAVEREKRIAALAHSALQNRMASIEQELRGIRRSQPEEEEPPPTLVVHGRPSEPVDRDLQQLVPHSMQALQEEIRELRGCLEGEKVQREAQDAMIQESIKRHLVYEKVARELHYSSFEELIEQRIADERALLHGHESLLRERLGTLEQSIVGDTAERLGAELREARERLDQLQGRLPEGSQLEQRLALVESLVGLARGPRGRPAPGAGRQAAASEWGGHQLPLMERLDCLEGMLGAAAERHAHDVRDLAATQGAHGRTLELLSAALPGQAEAMERLRCLEGLLGTSSGEGGCQDPSCIRARLDQVSSRLAACEAQGPTLARVEADVASAAAEQGLLGKRVLELSASLAETTDEMAKELQALHGKIGQMDEHLEACKGHSECLAELQRDRDAAADNISRVWQDHASVREQVGRVEASLSSLSAEHATELELVRGESVEQARKLQAMQSEQAVWSEDLAAARHQLMERIERLERLLDPAKLASQAGALGTASLALELEELKSAHAMHLIELKAIKAAHANHFTVSECLGTMDKHSKQLEEAQRRLDQLQKRMVTCEKGGSTQVIPLHRSGSRSPNHRTGNDTHHAELKERVDHLECLVGAVDKHTKELEGMKAAQAKYAKQLASIKGTPANQTARCSRLTDVGKAMDDATDRYAKGLAATSATLDQLNNCLSPDRRCESPVKTTARVQSMGSWTG
mmetsp:Transcript_37774/g.107907  ORF Transcript_37774/g.107907 Transcript_37774/m.107907 type:complete len:814 (+) Transcript_37774:56-2497(+)